ncbi:MAG: helix-turn-helix domain-containing protein [Campylobacter sp.]|nr:helix-turn-helix domain-containing protein [Campylobacter sp.]
MNDKYISAKEALAELNISKATLYRLVQSGKILVNKINSKVIYYSLNSINAYKSGKPAQTI